MSSEEVKAISKRPYIKEVLTNITSLNSENILDIKNLFIDGWHPRNAQDAIVMLNLLHVLTNDKAWKNIKRECAAMLDRCEYCDNERIDTETGLKVLRKRKPERKVYEDTEETLELERKIKELKDQLKEAKDRAGFTRQRDDGYDYAVKF